MLIQNVLNGLNDLNVLNWNLISFLMPRDSRC